MDKQYKVIVIDDASFMLKAISEILESDPDIQVIDTAQNGLEGLKKIKELQPDIVTLDIDMPVMNGIEAIRHIMIESPVPIVVLSSLFSDGAITFEALRLGVVDFVAKPSGAISHDIHKEKQKIIDRVKLAHTACMGNIRRVRINTQEDKASNLSETNGDQPLDYLIAIGTSISGPNTFLRVMSALSPRLPAAVVVVLEISPQVLPSFVEKFNEYVPWKIDIAQEGAILEQGSCYLHSNQTSLIINTNEDGSYCFNVGVTVEDPLDKFFSAAADAFKQYTVGVLLTGYGDDGANGFAKIRENSGVTIAQSLDTCVYPNLTDNAIKRNTVDQIVEENKLAETIEKIVQ